MNTMPATPSVADAVAESRRLLEEAQSQDHNHWNDTDSAVKAQASAQMATGHVLLAMGEELATVRAQLDQLAGIRREVAGLSQAVRELTATAAKGVESLQAIAWGTPDIATAISGIPDHSKVLGDIATAVESLATSIDERPRRWFGRRKTIGGAA